MFTLISDSEAVRYLLIVFAVLVAIALVLAIINLVLSLNQKAVSRKMDLERYEKRRRNRWR